MKKFAMLMAAAMLAGICGTSAQIRLGGRTLDTRRLVKAGADIAKAVTLTDADIAKMCRESIEYMDANNQVADSTSEYALRLDRLTKDIKDVNGMPLNFKVYLVKDINAFASGDGSVRVFSALMDLMDDDELVAVIGHEIGHVAHTDVKDAMKNTYLSSAARNAAGAAGGTLAKLTDSQLGELAQALTGARFSQKQETQADEYGVDFCVKYGYDPYGMANSLKKLAGLSEGQQASAVQKMFSSHPDSEKRAAHAKALADAAVANRK